MTAKVVVNTGSGDLTIEVLSKEHFFLCLESSTEDSNVNYKATTVNAAELLNGLQALRVFQKGMKP